MTSLTRRPPRKAIVRPKRLASSSSFPRSFAVAEPSALGNLVRAQALPFSVTRELADQLDIAAADLYKLMGVSERTAARRLAGKQALSRDETEKVIRIKRVVDIASEIFGSLEKARHWLARPNSQLGDQSPLSQLDLEVGAEHVRALLTRIDHGVYV